MILKDFLISGDVKGSSGCDLSENYGCDPTLCEKCDEIKVWDEPKGSNTGVHLLIEEERYMFILKRWRSMFC